MSVDQWLIIAILVVVLGLFLWGKIRYDIIALIALFSSTLLGLIPVQQMFSGFGHPATITVAIVLILSYGLTKSGAVEGITRLVDPLSRDPILHTSALILIAAFFSMFMNNVGALALLMPVAIQSTINAKRSPSTVLMPLAFGSILGGMVTLIGTPTNIIISAYRQEVTGQAFTMFDFTPVGGVVALVGILFIITIGWRFVATRKSSVGLDVFDIESYLFEIKIEENSVWIDKTVKELEMALDEYDIDLNAIIHKREYIHHPPKKHHLQRSNVLILEGSSEDIDKFVSKFSLSLLGADSSRHAVDQSNDTEIMEVVVAPGSNLEGRVVAQIRFKYNYGMNLLALSREGRIQRGRLKKTKLRIGDVLLLQGEKDEIEEKIKSFGCFPLAERGVDFGKRRYSLLALGIFIGAIAATVLGLVSIQLSLGIAMIAMLLFNIIPVEEMYDAVDWPVIILLGAMIPIGGVLESTGTTQLIANGLLHISDQTSIVVILTAILIITMTLSDMLNNAATTILMAPIGYTIATSAGVNPDSFLIVIAIGASCAFLTPIGHQNNALVLGPGGYKFSDYWKVGLPLEILIVTVTIPLTLYFWPL